LRPLLPLLLLPLLLIAAGDPPSDAGDDGALQSELDALFRELGGSEVPMLDPGVAPDLLIVSTRQVLGEIAPCG